MKNVLVTGGKGQLASCLNDITNNIKAHDFIYVDIDELDITKPEKVNTFFRENKITHCINCAAYTAVDAAESNRDVAEAVNATGAKNLAKACSDTNAILIQISTDFVFSGKQTSLYTEEDQEDPLGIYGLTKLNGEKAVFKYLKEHFIIRTSWLYSEYNHNFLKTMLKLGRERDKLGVVCNQIGTPTYASDLAMIIVKVIMEGNTSYGTYHYSNEGVASWYDFAKAIFDISKIEIDLSPIKSEAYPTPAERPKFSVFDKSKIKKGLKLEIPYWRDSLKKCISKLDDND